MNYPANDPKWEFWTNGRRRSRTLCITLYADELVIAHHAVGSDGCMSVLNAISCAVEHLPKLIHALNRALTVANERKLISQS